ncbi:hypothetical protein [Streptomyces sp. NBC_00057]|uniref:hypothetical protein n=1 Tax=Streptomyces sp. NBC_00057 TaxID=2975634 RepID=UPI00324B6DD6
MLPDDIADSIPCGDDVDTFVVAAVARLTEAGLTEIAFVQVVGDHQSAAFS